MILKLNSRDLKLFNELVANRIRESYLGKNLIKLLSQKKNIIFLLAIRIFQKKKNHIRLDITSKHFIKKLPEKIDIVIHLAAISNDIDCKKNKKKCFKTNVLGTKNILRAAKIKKIKKTSFCIYGMGLS